MESRNRRLLFTADARFSIATVAGKAVLKGYPITYGGLSDDRGGYKVRIAQGAGRASKPTFALFNHNYDFTLATTDNNSLRVLPPDQNGIPVEIDLPEVTYARDLQELIACGIVKGMSFAAIPDSVKTSNAKEDGQNIVTFESFEFDEVTVTPIPAFAETSISVAAQTPASHTLASTSRTASLNSFREQIVKLQRMRLDLLTK